MRKTGGFKSGISVRTVKTKKNWNFVVERCWYSWVIVFLLLLSTSTLDSNETVRHLDQGFKFFRSQENFSKNWQPSVG